MSDTIPLVFCPAETWVDAYAETGLPVGTPLIINTVISKTKVYGSIASSEPSNPSDAVVPIPNAGAGLSAVVTAGESGFWLRSTTDSHVSVQDGNLP